MHSTINPTHISINYAVSELVGCGLSLVVLFIFLIHLRNRRVANPAKSSSQQYMDNCLVVWTLAFFARSIIMIFAWTDITHSFSQSCYGDDGYSYCESCDRTAKEEYLTIFIVIAAQLLFFYKINTKFQSEHFMQRVRRWMFVVAAMHFGTTLEVLRSSHIGYLMELHDCGEHQYSVCELSDYSEIQSDFSVLIPINFALSAAALIALNAAFIWRAHKVWKQSSRQKIGSTKKIQSMEHAINSVVRHCILAFSLIFCTIVVLMTFTFGGEYHYLAGCTWVHSWRGLCFLMFTPFMDSPYQMMFGPLHRFVFKKYRDRYSKEVYRVEREQRFADIEKGLTPSKLGAVPEDEMQIDHSPSIESPREPSRGSSEWDDNSLSPFSILQELGNEEESTSLTNPPSRDSEEDDSLSPFEIFRDLSKSEKKQLDKDRDSASSAKPHRGRKKKSRRKRTERSNSKIAMIEMKESGSFQKNDQNANIERADRQSTPFIYVVLVPSEWRRFDVARDDLQRTIQVTNPMLTDRSPLEQERALDHMIARGALKRECISGAGRYLEIKHVEVSREPMWRIQLVDESTASRVVKYFPDFMQLMKSQTQKAWRVTEWQNANERCSVKGKGDSKRSSIAKWKETLFARRVTKPQLIHIREGQPPKLPVK